jgi:hypothetical protein
VQSLVDDDLVHCEKIGISNYFWSFPSEAAVKLDAEASKLRSRLHTCGNEEARLREDLATEQAGKEDTQQRQDLLRRVAVLEEEVAAKRAEVDTHSANDPERYEALSECCVWHLYPPNNEECFECAICCGQKVIAFPYSVQILSHNACV